MYRSVPGNLVGWNKNLLEKLKVKFDQAKQNNHTTIQFNHWVFNIEDVQKFLK